MHLCRIVLAVDGVLGPPMEVELQGLVQGTVVSDTSCSVVHLQPMTSVFVLQSGCRGMAEFQEAGVHRADGDANSICVDVDWGLLLASACWIVQGPALRQHVAPGGSTGKAALARLHIATRQSVLEDGTAVQQLNRPVVRLATLHGPERGHLSLAHLELACHHEPAHALGARRRGQAAVIAVEPTLHDGLVLGSQVHAPGDAHSGSAVARSTTWQPQAGEEGIVCIARVRLVKDADHQQVVQAGGPDFLMHHVHLACQQLAIDGVL
mmetsp:Transcript_28711/g.46099  ORF Transcript_28711/g.46099 Transcript_28711/m.46099 type:complete len:266 (-) Transcript_28711:1043-1840(-)